MVLFDSSMHLYCQYMTVYEQAWHEQAWTGPVQTQGRHESRIPAHKRDLKLNHKFPG